MSEHNPLEALPAQIPLTQTQMTSFAMACPQCRGRLVTEHQQARCKECGRAYFRQDGIWRFRLSSRAQLVEEFLGEYRRLREGEGWGASNAKYYRDLPHVAANDPQRVIWRIVAKNFRRLLDLLAEIKPRRILDNGSGNGWLSYQLTRRGYTVAALDISDDVRDGLGASIYYEYAFERYQAEFERLPFCQEQFDVIVFSASLHYSNDLSATLQEAARVLGADGKIIIVAAPVFKLQQSGAVLVVERERKFKERFGVAPASRGKGFLTELEIQQTAQKAHLSVTFSYSDEHWLKSLRRAWIQRKIGREPARFPLIVMQKL